MRKGTQTMTRKYRNYLIHREENAADQRGIAFVMAILIIISMIFSAIIAEDSSIYVDPITIYQHPAPADDGYVFMSDAETALCGETVCFTLRKEFSLRADGLETLLATREL